MLFPPSVKGRWFLGLRNALQGGSPAQLSGYPEGRDVEKFEALDRSHPEGRCERTLKRAPGRVAEDVSGKTAEPT